MPTSVIVAVCTYRRNGPLRQLLSALTDVAAAASDRAAVGVVVVDDDASEPARPVVDQFARSFELGIHYRVSGRQNIAAARNLAVGTASALGDWVAMTDDDCEPTTPWIVELLDVQQRFKADAVTGPCLLRLPPGAPRWLSEQPFLSDGYSSYERDELVQTAGTHNSMIRSQWWHDHSDLRFDERLGTIGGEDMVFYRSAQQRGLAIYSARKAVVFGNEPVERTTFRYLVARRFWLGNTSVITRREIGEASRFRLLLSAVNALRKAIQRPFVRLARGEPPEWRYAAMSVVSGFGALAGVLGVRVRHH